MKLLHLAHCPMQNIPLEFVKMERLHGHISDLVYFESPLNDGSFPEIPQIMLDNPFMRWYRRLRMTDRRTLAHARLISAPEGAPEPMPEPLLFLKPTIVEKLWRAIRDGITRARLPGIIDQFKLSGYDAVFFHGARDLTWKADLAKCLKNQGAKIISVFHGTELRVEGVVKPLDDLSDLHLTVEHDHLSIHPKAKFIFPPFDISGFRCKEEFNSCIRVIHAPSDRYNKGTDYILPVIERLKKEYEFEFLLVEGESQTRVREIKATCDVCIDQIGNRGGTGYGVSSLECFAMGIPCITDFTPQFEQFIPDHPFIVAHWNTLEAALKTLLENPPSIAERGRRSYDWILKYHGYSSVYQELESALMPLFTPLNMSLSDSTQIIYTTNPE